jgi:hypothetical protein
LPALMNFFQQISDPWTSVAKKIVVTIIHSFIRSSAIATRVPGTFAAFRVQSGV